ncbi:MAG: FimV/HubP family polar landmark protein, partial [Aeromonadaceae bacterium]
MGLHISRLALAVALSLHLATPLQAAEQLDEFYTEIKGPDAPPSPLITPQAKPVAQPAPVQAPKRNSERTRVAEPVPQPFLVAEAEGASVRSYGPVKPADTLRSIAERMRPSRNVSVHQTMLAIYRSNPSAFAGGRLNGLYRGVRLTIPSQAQIQAESESEAQRLL